MCRVGLAPSAVVLHSVVLNQEQGQLYLSLRRLERKGYIHGFWKLMLQNEDADKIVGTNTVQLQQLLSYSCINDWHTDYINLLTMEYTQYRLAIQNCQLKHTTQPFQCMSQNAEHKYKLYIIFPLLIYFQLSHWSSDASAPHIFLRVWQVLVRPLSFSK